MRCSVYIVCPSVLSCSNLKLHQTLEAKNIFKREKIMRHLTFDPGLTLSSFWTTRPRLHCTSVRRRQRAVHPKMTLKPMLYPKPAPPLIYDRGIRATCCLGTCSLCKSLHVQKWKLLLTCNTTSPAWWRTNAPPITTPPINTAAKNTLRKGVNLRTSFNLKARLSV